MAQKKFARTEPAGIEIGKIASRPPVKGRVGALVWNQYHSNVKPHAPRKKQGQQQASYRVSEQRRQHVTTYADKITVRFRILISGGIGLASGMFCWYLLRHFRQGAGDFRWAILAAQDLLARKNPYQRTLQLYPLPAALFGLPFIRLKGDVAGGIFYGVSSALLAFGLTKDGYRRLFVFLAYPYWAGILTAQWSPLIMAGALLPLALPAALAKPQLGLPVVLAHPNRKGFLACAVLILLSLAVAPRWPENWHAGLGQYQHFILC